jgi:hypothetical protein
MQALIDGGVVGAVDGEDYSAFYPFQTVIRTHQTIRLVETRIPRGAGL